MSLLLEVTSEFLKDHYPTLSVEKYPSSETTYQLDVRTADRYRSLMMVIDPHTRTLYDYYEYMKHRGQSSVHKFDTILELINLLQVHLGVALADLNGKSI